MLGDGSQSAYRYEKAAAIALTAYREEISLRQAALKLGLLSGEAV